MKASIASMRLICHKMKYVLGRAVHSLLWTSVFSALDMASNVDSGMTDGLLVDVPASVTRQRTSSLRESSTIWLAKLRT